MKRRRIVIGIAILSAATVAADFYIFTDAYEDILKGKSTGHILSDLLLGLMLTATAILAWFYLRSRLTISRQGADDNAFIEEQFAAWNLTQAEAHVAHWIIRGLNFYQIADLLEKSERTVRQQAMAVYAKTGFRNRSELTGHFVETLHKL